MTGLSAISCPDTYARRRRRPRPARRPTPPPRPTSTPAAITNTGTATGTPPIGPDVTDTSSVTDPGDEPGVITIVKSASRSASFIAVGTPVTYNYKVTNTGNVTLNVTVTDPWPACRRSAARSSNASPRRVETCTATYTTTATDVTAGADHQHRHGHRHPAVGPAGHQHRPGHHPGSAAPSITIAKSASDRELLGPGHAVTYSYLVTNTGNVTLNPVTVTDPMAGLSAISCPDTSLAPGATRPARRPTPPPRRRRPPARSPTPARRRAPRRSGPKVTDTSSLTIPARRRRRSPSSRPPRSPSYSAIGHPGHLHLHGHQHRQRHAQPVTVTDPMAGLSAISCGGAPSSPPGAHETCTATYTTTQTDVDRRRHHQHRHRHGHPAVGPAGHRHLARSPPATPRRRSPSPSPPAIASYSAAGHPDHLHLHGHQHRQRHAQPGHRHRPDDGPVGDQLPGHLARRRGNETCTATYTTTQADVDAGSITNTGTATGTPPIGPDVTNHLLRSPSRYAAPSITIVKSASVTELLGPGTPVTYTYLVTNTGNVTLNPVTVTDPMAGLSAISCPDTSLGRRAPRDLHGHLHHHPDRRRPPARSPTPAPPPAPRRRARRSPTTSGDHPATPGVDHDRQVRQRSQLLGPGRRSPTTTWSPTPAT